MSQPDCCFPARWSSKMIGSSVWDRDHILTRQTNLVCSKIDEYFKDGKYADVNITCQNRIFKCHRLVLAAVSEYFEAMFGGDFLESSTQDVTLREIDSVTFEQVVNFAYRGEIAAINDDNVLDLLRASDILRLQDVEHLCVHYLTEKNIPMDCALQLHLFASAANKVSLIPFTSRFLLQHLDHFCRDRDFLQMSFRELSTILSYFVGTSWDEEKALLNVILQWLSGRSTSDIPKDRRRSSFMELAQKVPFKFVSAEYVAELYDNSNGGADDNNDVTDLPVEISVATDLDSRTNADEPALHVYTKHYNKDGERVSSIFSLRTNSRRVMKWDVSPAITPFIRKMRIIQSDGRLYCLKLSEERWTFSVSTAIDLSTDAQILTLPSGFDRIPACVIANKLEKSIFSLCHIKSTHNIYLGGLHKKFDFQCYNTELDAWSLIPSSVSELFEPTKPVSLISDDYRLFMTGWEKDTTSYSANLFAAYDPRTGKPEKLNHEGLNRLVLPNHCCTHKNRIYLTGHDKRGTDQFTFNMAIYDPFADRWDTRKFTSSCKGCKCIGRHDDHRLVTFNNQLWMFGFADGPSGYPLSICAQSYDSFLQTWRSQNEDLHTTMSEKLCQKPVYFLDVVEFKWP